MTNLRTIVFFAIAMIHAGCYDAPTVAPYPEPWLIDDFSDPNGHPIDPHFEPWGCRPSDDAHPIGASDCNTMKDPDLSSGRTVLHLGASLYPYSNGDDTFTRAEVATYVRGAQAYDLRPYDYFSFSWKILIDRRSPLDLGQTSLNAQIFCTRTPAADGKVPSKPFLLNQISIPIQDNYWIDDLDLKMAGFNPAEAARLADASEKYRQDCLANADGIKFTIDSAKTVEFGKSVPFDLYVDDIMLKTQQ